MVDSLVLRIEFPNGQSFGPGIYCLEVQIDEAASSSCSVSIDFRHRATIWQSLDTLVTSHSL